MEISKTFSGILAYFHRQAAYKRKQTGPKFVLGQVDYCQADGSRTINHNVDSEVVVVHAQNLQFPWRYGFGQ